MIIIGICVFIGIFWAIAVGYDPAIEAPFGAFCGLIVGFLVSMVVGAFVYDGSIKPVATVELVSLADGAGVEGHFFLGSGYIDSKSVFTWYESRGDNSFVRKSADADESTIHYLKDDKKPYYVVNKNCSDGGFFQTWALNVESGCWDGHYDFYIPRGSIVQSYKLDNQ